MPRYYEIEQALRGRIADLDPHSPLPSDAEQLLADVYQHLRQHRVLGLEVLVERLCSFT